MRAKHFGQLTVASVAWQYGQDPPPGEAGAPQFGQWSADASVMVGS
jgi:hypothetical protein